MTYEVNPYGCIDGYPEHDYRLLAERDGIRVSECRRCGAEAEERVDEES